jgi:hypothetical protein
MVPPICATKPIKHQKRMANKILEINAKLPTKTMGSFLFYCRDDLAMADAAMKAVVQAF